MNKEQQNSIHVIAAHMFELGRSTELQDFPSMDNKAAFLKHCRLVLGSISVIKHHCEVLGMDVPDSVSRIKFKIDQMMNW